jgi:hypothetical protein
LAKISRIFVENKKNMNIKCENRKIITIITHILFWVGVLSVPFLFQDFRDKIEYPLYFPLTFVFHFLLLISIFYTNVFFVFPYIFRRYRSTREILPSYLGSQISFMMIILLLGRTWRWVWITYLDPTLMDFVVEYFKNIPFAKPELPPTTAPAIISIIFIVAVSTSARLIMDWMKREEELKDLENERLSSELSFLRSQISPHFMFNVLNSIVSLARKKSDQLEPVVIKLSQLMRYMLYESDDKKVSLDKEIEYLQSYIDLQRLRFGTGVEILFQTNENLYLHSIEPMLLVPFVENAFKHGIGWIRNPKIEISLKSEPKFLYFQVKNQYNPESQEQKEEDSGIGLRNVSRRLGLLYENRHDLKVYNEGNTFIVELRLDL